MSVQLDRPITWASVARVALAAAAEYGMLSLIEDAPFAVKLATVLCSVAALAALESRDWLESLRARLFATAMIALGAIYLGFLGYAVNYYLDKAAIRHGLEARYAAASEFVSRQIPATNNAGSLDQPSVNRLAIDIRSWETETSAWLGNNMGEAARARFLDPASRTTWLWGPGPSYEERYSNLMNRVSGERKNLAVIIETGAYGN